MTAKTTTPRPAHDLILAFNAGREPERLAIKYEKMAADPIAFERGSCHLFYHRLAELGALGSAPAAWSCNDLHLENFGTYLGDNGLVYFDVNDFDEAALVPMDWDIVRLATSVLVSARKYEMPRRSAVAMATLAIERFRTVILDGKATWIERATAEGPVGALIESLKSRSDRDLVRKHTTKKDGELRLDLELEKKMLPVDDHDREALQQYVAEVTVPGHESDEVPAHFVMLDAARRIAGTGNLGNPRFVILAERSDKPGKPHLLDLKFAPEPSVLTHTPYTQPAWPDDAQRITAVQRRAQAATPRFLRPVRFDGKPYVLKQLQPTEDRLKVKKLAKTESEFATALSDMAALSASALLRSTGHEGSATADELAAHVGEKGFEADILARARLSERAVEEDFKAFARAYKDAVVVP